MKKLALLLLLCPASSWALTVSVYHTSDVHGWYFSRPAKWDKQNSTRTIGGFAALSALVKADKNPTLLLDSGDTFQGTPEGTLTKGLATAEMMRLLGYSAATVGNHDYDYTEANLRVVISSSTLPWLGANVYQADGGKPAPYLEPYKVFTKGGKRIAVIGIAGRHTATSTLPANVKHLDFRDEAAEAARWARHVRETEKPDAVIVLAHLGFGGDAYGRVDVSTWTPKPDQASYGTLAIARAAKPDVIFGGHIHTALLKGFRDTESGSLLAESGTGLTDVTRVTLEFDDATGELKSSSAELVPLWTDVTGEDPAVLAALAKYTEQVNREMGKVVGRSEADLGVSKTGLDSNIGNWFADAMRRQARTDAAFQNTAGIRAELRKGDILLRDVFQVMPFENTLVVLTMTGDQVVRLIADNLRGGSSKLQLSGLKVKFRQTPEGPRDIAVEFGGKPLAPGQKITVATNNYLTTGGTGGKVFSEAEKSEDTMLPIRDLLIRDIGQNPVKAAPEGGRITRLE